ncbi:MAG: hypothetical protein ACYC08_09410, partial [Armatimonadota bacterium]
FALWMGRYWRWTLKPYLALNANPLGGDPLVADRKVQNILLCPSDDASKVKYDSTSYSYSMSFYYSPEQINSLSAFANTIPPGPSFSCTPQTEAAVAYPSRKVLVTEWTTNHSSQKVAWNNPATAWQGARNCLFADGHVRRVKTTDMLPANDGLPDINLTVNGIAGFDVR